MVGVSEEIEDHADSCNDVKLFLYGDEKVQEYPPFRAIGPNQLTSGDLSTCPPSGNETIRVPTPLIYRPLDRSPNPKPYALMAVYDMFIFSNMVIDGSVGIEVYVETNATNYNPYDSAQSSFRFLLITSNDREIGHVDIPANNFTDTIQILRADFEVNNFEFSADDAIVLQIWYAGIGRLHILYGSQKFQSYISIPAYSMKIHSDVHHDRDNGIITICTNVTNSFGINDIKGIQLLIYEPWESAAIHKEEIDIATLYSSSEMEEANCSILWTGWEYKDLLDDGEIPYGNYTVRVMIKDNNSIIWDRSYLVNIYTNPEPVYIKIYVIITIITLGSILRVIGYYRGPFRRSIGPIFVWESVRKLQASKLMMQADSKQLYIIIMENEASGNKLNVRLLLELTRWSKPRLQKAIEHLINKELVVTHQIGRSIYITTPENANTLSPYIGTNETRIKQYIKDHPKSEKKKIANDLDLDPRTVDNIIKGSRGKNILEIQDKSYIHKNCNVAKLEIRKRISEIKINHPQLSERKVINKVYNSFSGIFSREEIKNEFNEVKKIFGGAS